MDQLYTISASGGSYDDAWERVDFVTDDLAKGEAYVAKMNALRDVVIVATKQRFAFQNTWQLANPRPRCRAPAPVEVPRWPNNVKPTKQMRDERKRLEEINRLDYAEANKPLYDWTQANYQAGVNFVATFSADVQEGIAKNYDDTYWAIEPVAWLE